MTIRNWEQWEREERRAFYRERLAEIEPGVVRTPELLAAWVEACNAHIEAERTRLLAAHGQGEAGGER